MAQLFHRMLRRLAEYLKFSRVIARLTRSFAASRQNCFAIAPEGLFRDRYLAWIVPPSAIALGGIGDRGIEDLHCNTGILCANDQRWAKTQCALAAA